MPARSDRRSSRAVSEVTGLAILVGFTVLVTASVGVSVLVADSGDSRGVNANFTFDYRSDQGMLVVTHERGDPIAAGNLLIKGGQQSVTWSEVANQDAEAMVEPGGLPIQLSDASAWGATVTQGQTVEIYYAPDAENRTLLDAWEG